MNKIEKGPAFAEALGEDFGEDFVENFSKTLDRAIFTSHQELQQELR